MGEIKDLAGFELGEALMERMSDGLDAYREKHGIHSEEEANRFFRILTAINREGAEIEEMKRVELEKVAAFYDKRLERNRADLVKVDKSIKKAELKKAMALSGSSFVDEASGEVVPGVSVVERTSVNVKAGE